MNIPNILTLLRFLLVPVFIYSFYNYSGENYFIPITIFIIAGMTDVLDGLIARKFNQITKWGMLMDPLADKAMQISALFVLTDKGIIPLWIVAVVLAKELFMVVGSSILYRRKVIVHANWYGKAATVLFYVAIVAIVFISQTVGMYLMIIAVGMTLYAATRYTIYHSGKRQEYIKS